MNYKSLVRFITYETHFIQYSKHICLRCIKISAISINIINGEETDSLYILLPILQTAHEIKLKKLNFLHTRIVYVSSFYSYYYLFVLTFITG